jgi:hypothetical protein
LSVDDAVVRQPLEIRLAGMWRVCAACFGVMWVAVLAFAINTLPSSQILIAALLGILGVAMVVRIETLKVVASEAGLLVHNFNRTRRLRWDQVKDFRSGRAPLLAIPPRM